MARTQSEEYLPRSQDVLSLSFLDVLSCGFGAATLLFLIFSVMPHMGTRLGSIAGKSVQEGKANAVGITTIDDLVRHSVVFIEVRIKSPPHAIALIPSDPWDQTLPSRATRITPTSPNGGAEVLFAARIDSGKQVKDQIRVRLIPPTPPADLVVEITVAMGGSTSPPGPVTIKAADLAKSGGVVAVIDLHSGDSKTWVATAGSK